MSIEARVICDRCSYTVVAELQKLSIGKDAKISIGPNSRFVVGKCAQFGCEGDMLIVPGTYKNHEGLLVPCFEPGPGPGPRIYKRKEDT